MPVTTRITTFFRIGNLNLYLPLLLDGWVDPSYILRSFILSHHLMKHSESWSVSIHKNNTTCIFWRFVPDFAGLPLPVSKPVQFFQVSHWQLLRSSLGDLRYGNRSVFSLFFIGGNMVIALLVDVIIPVLFFGGWEFSEMLEVKFVLKYVSYFFMKFPKREVPDAFITVKCMGSVTWLYLNLLYCRWNKVEIDHGVDTGIAWFDWLAIIGDLPSNVSQKNIYRIDCHNLSHST